MTPTDETPPRDSEQRVIVEFSDDQVYALALRVAMVMKEQLKDEVKEEIKDEFFADVGRAVFNKAMIVIGIAVVALFGWLAATGKLNK